jgi:hypothetical protein
MRGAGLALVLILAACVSSSAPSPSSVASPSPASNRTASLACTSPIPRSGQLALVSLDSQTAAIDLVSNPSQPQRLCLINNVFTLAPAAAGGPRFVGRSEVSYIDLGSPGGILRLNLATGISTTVVSWNSGGIFPFGGAGGYGWSPDGKSLAYLFDPQTGNGPELRLVSRGADRLLATLPAVPGRGGNPEDSNLLAFSPDGQYFALVETFTGPGSGEQAPFQVRRADGTLVAAYPASPGDVTTSGALSGKRTMAVWAGTGSTLYFRPTDSPGVERWTPQSQQTMVMPSVQWSWPAASPDGRWIAYTVPDGQGMPHVAVYDRTTGLSSSLTNAGGINPHFVASNLVWYAAVRPCTPEEQQAPPASRICGGLGLPDFPKTGQEFVFDVLTKQEVSTKLGDLGVLDIWPLP